MKRKMTTQHPFNVLSIDFDFFQHVTKDTILHYYPDGHDYDTQLSSIIWSTYYADDHTASVLKKIHSAAKSITEIQKIITDTACINPECPTGITNSHRHIYDLITKYYDDEKYTGLNIYNIDMHHDMYDTSITTKYINGQPITKYKTHELDCGNWLTHVKKKYPQTDITWICHEISDDCIFVDHIEKDFSSLYGKQFDLIFLCRSDIYVPPHLDKQFDKLRKTIQNHFHTTWIEDNIIQPRNIYSTTKQLKKLYSSMKLPKNA